MEQVCTGSGNGAGGCGALLLVEEADVFKTENNCRDETTTFATFRCSECGVLTDLSPQGCVPSHIFRTLKEEKT